MKTTFERLFKLIAPKRDSALIENMATILTEAEKLPHDEYENTFLILCRHLYQGCGKSPW